LEFPRGCLGLGFEQMAQERELGIVRGGRLASCLACGGGSLALAL
jgi:hypothetical protein